MNDQTRMAIHAGGTMTALRTKSHWILCGETNMNENKMSQYKKKHSMPAKISCHSRMIADVPCTDTYQRW